MQQFVVPRRQCQEDLCLHLLPMMKSSDCQSETSDQQRKERRVLKHRSDSDHASTSDIPVTSGFERSDSAEPGFSVCSHRINFRSRTTNEYRTGTNPSVTNVAIVKPPI